MFTLSKRTTWLAPVLLLCIHLLCIHGTAWAQETDAPPFITYEIDMENNRTNRSYDNSGMYLVCWWDNAEIRAAPGEEHPTIGALEFGEEFKLDGVKAYVIEENRFYLKGTRGGISGWVKEDLLKDGGTVVILKRTNYFDTKRSLAEVKDGHFFEAGEMAIMVNFDEAGEWMRLVGRNRTPDGETKLGWIRDIDRVSFDPDALEIADRIYEIRQTEDLRLQRQALENLRDLRGFEASRMEFAVEAAILKTYYQASADRPGSGTRASKAATSKPRASNSTRKAAPEKTPPPEVEEDKSLVVEKVVDMDTGKYYNRITETGSIMEVDGPKRPKNIYWCYHKTRPIGTKVLLHVPGGGRVALEVVARLRQDNPNAIGLGKAVLERFYGTRFAKEATFSYPQ